MDARSIAADFAATIGADPSVRSILLVGSAARGLTDASSDVDLLVIAEPDLVPAGPPGAVRRFRLPRGHGAFEKWSSAGRFVDVEIVSPTAVEQLVARLADGSASEADLLLAAAIHDAAHLAGEPAPALAYPAPLATAVAERHLAGLVPSSAIFAASYERGDVLAYASRQADLTIRVIGLLGAVNRQFIPTAAPKWLPSWIDRCALRPDETTAALERAITNPSAGAAARVDELVAAVLDLVDAHVSDVSTAAARYALTLRP